MDVLDQGFKVLFISGAEGGTRRYRCFHPQEQLELYGIPSGFRTSDDLRLYADFLDYDIFFFHRVSYTRLVADVLKLIHQTEKIAIFETDDLVFEPDLVKFDGFYRGLPPERVRQYEQGVEGQLKTLEECDYASTTTGYLAEALRRRGKKVIVNRNALHSKFVQLADQMGISTARDSAGQVILGYISGSASHDQDFETIADALWFILHKYPQVELRVIGPLNLSRRFAAFRDRIKLFPLVPWEEVPHQIRGLDINLAPLEQDNPFCQSKSEVKYFEAGVFGVPTVASRTEAFEFAIRQGETGFVADNTAEWIQFLEMLIENPERRREMGAAARRDALDNYTPHARGRQLVQSLRSLAADRQSQAARLPDQGQIHRRIIDILIGYLQEDRGQLKPGGAARPLDNQYDQPERRVATIWSALREIRQARRRPGARLLAFVKHTVKKLARRVYRLELDGQVYELIDELRSNQVYGQTFQATAPSLCRVDVLFATFGRINSPDVIFHLRASPDAEDVLATCTVSTSLLHDSRFFPFAFEPIPDSAGKQYFFSVESPGAVRGDAVGVWSHLNPVDAGGTMYQGGQPIPGRLAHTVYYNPQISQDQPA